MLLMLNINQVWINDKSWDMILGYKIPDKVEVACSSHAQPTILSSISKTKHQILSVLTRSTPRLPLSSTVHCILLHDSGNCNRPSADTPLAYMIYT